MLIQRVGAIIGVTAALVVLVPVILVAFALFHTERWTADLAVTVDHVGNHGRSFSVEFTSGLPSEALDQTPTYVVSPGPPPSDVRVGEQLTCRLHQEVNVQVVGRTACRSADGS